MEVNTEKENATNKKEINKKNDQKKTRNTGTQIRT